MKRVVALAVVAALGGACGGAAKVKPEPTLPPTPEAVVTQVKKTVEDWRKAMEARSVDTLAPLYVMSPELIYVSQGRMAVGWEATNGALQTFFNSYSEVTIRIAEVAVVALGSEGAVASAAVTRRFGDGVTTVEETGAIIFVFRRAPDGWKITAQHYSYAPGM